MFRQTPGKYWRQPPWWKGLFMLVNFHDEVHGLCPNPIGIHSLQAESWKSRVLQSGMGGWKNMFICPSLFLDLCCQTLWCIEDTRLTWGSKLASIASDKHAATNKTQYLQRFQCSGYSHSSCSVLLQNWEWRTSPTWKCDLQEGCLGCMDQKHHVKWGYRANTCIVPKAMRLKCLVDKFRLVCSYTKALKANWKQTMKPGLGTNFCLLPFTQGTTTWIDRVWERRTKPWNEHGLSSNGYQHPLV